MYYCLNFLTIILSFTLFWLTVAYFLPPPNISGFDKPLFVQVLSQSFKINFTFTV